MTSSDAEWEPLPRGLLDEMAEAKTGWQEAPPKTLRRRRRKGSSSTHQSGAAVADPINVSNASCTDEQLHADVEAAAQSVADGGSQQHIPSSAPAGNGVLALASRGRMVPDAGSGVNGSHPADGASVSALAPLDFNIRAELRQVANSAGLSPSTFDNTIIEERLYDLDAPLAQQALARMAEADLTCIKNPVGFCRKIVERFKGRQTNARAEQNTTGHQRQPTRRSKSLPGSGIGTGAANGREPEREADRMERLQGIARRCSLPPKLFTDSFIPGYLSRLPPDLEQKVLYAAENDMRLRRGQKESPLGYFNSLFRRCGAEEALLEEDGCHICGKHDHIARYCPDRSAGPILPSQLGAWGQNPRSNPLLKADTCTSKLPAASNSPAEDMERSIAAEPEGRGSFKDELSWGDDAEAETRNCRAARVGIDPVPKQQQMAAEHIQECSPDVQLPAPDEGEAQQPGQQVQQHDSAQQLLQQRQERLQPQQQRTSLRHDAPSWDTRTCAVPASGTISGQLKVRDWEVAPPASIYSALPQYLTASMLPQALLLHEQQPYDPPLINEQQLYPPPHLPPLRPPPLHPAQLHPPTHMRQHPMLQPPGPQQLGDGRTIMQQHHAAQQEGDYYQDAHVQGWNSGSSAWTPMAALSQTQHPAHEYGGVAQLPLEPYHSAGMHFHRPPPGSGFNNPTIAAPTLSLPFDMLTSGSPDSHVQDGWPSPQKDTSLSTAHVCYAPGPQHLQPPMPPVDLLQLLQHPVQQSGLPQQQQAVLQLQASETGTSDVQPQAPMQQQPVPNPYQPPLLTQQPVQLHAPPTLPPPQQRSRQDHQMSQQHQAPASRHCPNSEVMSPDQRQSTHSAAASQQLPLPQLLPESPQQRMQQPQDSQLPPVDSEHPQPRRSAPKPLSGKAPPYFEQPASMLWSLLRCLCCSPGLHSSLLSWASKTAPGQEPDDVAAAVLQLIKLPGFDTASKFDFDDPYSRDPLLWCLLKLQGAVADALRPEGHIASVMPDELMYLLVHHLDGALAGGPPSEMIAGEPLLHSTLTWQVQPLLACGECHEQQRVQPTHCERLFFTVPATALVAASLHRKPRTSFAQVLRDAEAAIPWTCAGCGTGAGVCPRRQLCAAPPEVFMLQVADCNAVAMEDLQDVWNSIQADVNAGTLFKGFQRGHSSMYTLQAVLCQMLGSFGTLAGVVTVDGEAGWRLHCGFTEPQKFDAAYLNSANSIAGGVAPLLAFYTRV